MYGLYETYKVEAAMPRKRRGMGTPTRARSDIGESSEPGADIVTATRVRESFAEYVSQVAFTGRRIVVKRHGRPRAAIVPMEDLQLLRALEDRIDLKAALRALRERKTTAWSKVKAELGL